MDSDESRSLRAANSLRCFTGRFTELSDLELPNSTVTGFNFVCVGNLAFMGEGEVIGGVDVDFVGVIILDGWGVSSSWRGSHERR